MVMNDRVLNIQSELRQLGNKEIAEHSQRFFKTGNEQYGAGDKFLGIRVPALRRLVKKYKEVSIDETFQLLKSQFHEERLLSLLILVDIFKKAKKEDKKFVYTRYVNNTRYINNWDLVDCSAEHIVGAYLWRVDQRPIYNFASPKSLWQRRISIMSTFHYIKHSTEELHRNY